MFARDHHSIEEWLSASQRHCVPACASDVLNAIIENVNTKNINEDKWKTTPPKHWSRTDFLNFLYHCNSLDDVTVEALPGEEFLKQVSSYGGNICQLELSDFLKIDSKHGHLLYNRLQSEIRKHLKTSSSNSTRHTSCTSKNDVNGDTTVSNVWQIQLLPKPVEEFIYQDNEQSTISSRDDDGLFDYFTMSRHPSVLTDEFSATIPNVDLLELQPLHQQHTNTCFRSPTSNATESQQMHKSKPLSTSQCVSHTNRQQSVRRRRRPSEIGQSTRNGEHLWLFLFRQLQEQDGGQIHDKTGSESKEKIIKWEERSRGIFRIIDSHAVAELWSLRKHNRRKPMTFEKLARAIRWGKAEGFFASVPKNGNFPKKLCYRFGDKATSVWNS